MQPSWTLDHVAEVVYLVTQIQLTKQTNEALEELDKGDKDAIQVMFIVAIHTLSKWLLTV